MDTSDTNANKTQPAASNDPNRNKDQDNSTSGMWKKTISISLCLFAEENRFFLDDLLMMSGVIETTGFYFILLND